MMIDNRVGEVFLSFLYGYSVIYCDWESAATLIVKGYNGDVLQLLPIFTCDQYPYHVVMDTFLNASSFRNKDLREWNPRRSDE